MSDKEEHIYLMKVGEETKVELPPFHHTPSFIVTKVVKDKIPVGTEYYPGCKTIPSTQHPKTIRLINLNWNGVNVRAEYDHTSKLLKVIGGNVDSVTIRVL